MNRNNFSFSVLSWNVRGLGRQEKCDAVRDALSIYRPHIACIQETKLDAIDARKSKTFLPSFLNTFIYVPADGSRGGILTAWNDGVLSAGAPTRTPFSLTVPFTSTTTGHSFFLTNTYAPSDHRHTDAFLADLAHLAPRSDVNWALICDFNLLRSPDEKNNDRFDHNLADCFNSAIDGLALLELPLLDRLYTWSNRRAVPTLARLDRAFMNGAFAQLFPNTSLQAKSGPTSDHTPLLLTLPTTTPKASRFRFENCWLKHPNFLRDILPAWSNAIVPADATGGLVGRVKALLHAAKCWAKRNRARPEELCNASFIILLLDIYEESRVLSAGEGRLREQCRERVTLLIAQRAAY